jgi:hypothetical protein
MKIEVASNSVIPFQKWPDESIEMVVESRRKLQRNTKRALIVLWLRMLDLRDDHGELAWSNLQFRAAIPRWFSRGGVDGIRITTQVTDRVTRDYIHAVDDLGLTRVLRPGFRSHATVRRVYGAVTGNTVWIPQGAAARLDLA